MRVKKNYLKNC